MKKLLKKFLLITVFIPFFLSGCDWFTHEPVTPVVVNPSTLNLNRVGQQTMVWCWAAVSEMVLDYNNTPTDQCTIVSNWLMADCCTFPGFCQTTGTLQQIQQNLQYFGGLHSRLLNRSLSFAEIKDEINAGRPIIIAYQNFQSGHVVVIYGYDDNNNLYIYDPFNLNYNTADGGFVVPYGQIFRYANSQTWTNTIYQIRR